jgi:hypothetical protein
MTVNDYIEALDTNRKEAFSRLRQTILTNLPSGFEETIQYKMIGYVVPKMTYPKGYHCDGNEPLPFLHLANQKNYIALYHMGIYANKDLYNWFVEEYKNQTGKKPDMGKSCIRFKNLENIPFDLIAKLCTKFTPIDWIQSYEQAFKK